MAALPADGWPQAVDGVARMGTTCDTTREAVGLFSGYERARAGGERRVTARERAAERGAGVEWPGAQTMGQTRKDQPGH